MPHLRLFTGIRRCSLMYRLPASHGENRGSSPLGSANKIKHLMRVDQLVSNNCPINVYGQPWTACYWATCAMRREALPLKSWRHPAAVAFMWNRRICWCDVVANAAASAGSYGRRIERAEGFAQGMNRYPTLARAEIPTQCISGAFLTAKRAGS